VHLVRDLLDKAIVDRNGHEMGRADRVILEVRHGAPPRVVAIEAGASSLGARLGVAFGRWIAGLLHGLGVDEGQPLRLNVSEILGVTETIKADRAFAATPAANVEHALREIISRIPGAQR